MRARLVLTIATLLIAACGSAELTESPQESQSCFREGAALSLRPYEWDDVLALGRRTLPDVNFPSDNGGLTFISAGVTGGEGEKGLVLNLSSYDRNRETVVLKYSHLPPCETSASLRGLTPVASMTDVELQPVAQGEFTGYATLLDLDNATVDLRIMWLDDSRTEENERIEIAEGWVAKAFAKRE
jgi:hypothetical protein